MARVTSSQRWKEGVVRLWASQHETMSIEWVSAYRAPPIGSLRSMGAVPPPRHVRFAEFSEDDLGLNALENRKKPETVTAP
jgi:hypothetical protein